MDEPGTAWRRRKAQFARGLASVGILARLRDRYASRGRVPVLVLHRVAGTRRQRLPLAIPADDFRALVEEASRHYRIASWEECAIAARDRSPVPHLALTFDDGYADGFDVAWPILRRHRATAHFCLTSTFVDGASPLWWEIVADRFRPDADSFPLLASGEASYGTAAEAEIARLKTLPYAEWKREVDRLRGSVGADAQLTRALSWTQAKTMADEGAQILAHGQSHAILSRCDDDQLASELDGCLATTRSHLGDRVRGVAYPNGDRDDRVAEAARRSGFSFAFAGSHRYYRHGDSPMAIPRIPVEAAMYSVDGSFCWPLFEAEMLGVFDQLLLRRARGLRG